MFQETAPSWSTMTQSTAPPGWTRLEDKLFEQALVRFSEDLPDRWERIADELPGKSAEEVLEHYETLVHDVLEIDSGRVELPSYAEDSSVSGGGGWDTLSQISFGSKLSNNNKHGGGGGGDPERKKGTPWTEQEHK